MDTNEFRRFAPTEAEELADFLTGEVWPYHGVSQVERHDVMQRAAEGYYDNDTARTFWIVLDERAVGIFRLFDLDDGTPMFDIRVAETARGRGIGTLAMRWLTSYLFTELPEINRIEGTTRHDNRAMRQLFRRSGYVKEAHYRQAWPDESGTLHDTIGYAILREDWQNGTLTAPNFDDEPA